MYLRYIQPSHPYIDDTPRTLFKYRNFDKEGYGLQSLDELYFSPPVDFNDPFDTALPHLYFSSGSSREAILAHFRRTNKDFFTPPHSEEEIKRECEDFLSKIPRTLEEAQAIDQARADEEARKNGVCCFSEVEGSILMWSHYGHKHTGFCIGYRTHIMYESLRKEVDVIFQPVSYCSVCPKINPYDPGLTLDYWGSPFNTKHHSWEYEREWRLVLMGGARRILPLPQNVVKSVYLGLRIDPSNEKLLLKKLKQRAYPIEVYRAVRQFNSFELKFEAVDY